MALDVALAQIAPVWLDRDATLDKVIATMDEAAARGARLTGGRDIRLCHRPLGQCAVRRRLQSL